MKTKTLTSKTQNRQVTRPKPKKYSSYCMKTKRLQVKGLKPKTCQVTGLKLQFSPKKNMMI